ncbi:sensor histidine kinase [Polycladidibacter hongkongensis]|uniref:sensor histidine kinase n=1 Tax=Polycladidibacter hongkongensis TaxID=1647556 RepID=UPI0008379704|nr:HAMP domain-containing sensor histidine kinase [Pseudovibrio hongkongensis]
MTALPRLFRTTAFKLALIYIGAFSLLSVSLFFFIMQGTNSLMRAQMVQTIDTDLEGLAERYAYSGINGLASGIRQRSNRPNANLYLLVDYTGNELAGNIREVPESVLAQSDGEIKFIQYARPGDTPEQGHAYEAAVRIFSLPGEFRLLVGRDMSEQSSLRGLLGQALSLWLLAMLAIALVTYVFVNRRVLRRIDNLTKSSATLMSGDLSGRLDVTGTGDEFDRLAENLNTMLNRIEALMLGLKEVSDNIAHDLKTPLTRLHNRVEAELSRDLSAADARAALEETLSETDSIICTFNALLRIARMEAGGTALHADAQDLALLAADVLELYEPLAEEDDSITFSFDAQSPCPAYVDRQLVSQALANLIENAMKYGRPQQGDTPLNIVVAVKEQATGACLTVSDNGLGIQASDRVRACERFVRLDSARSKPGSGLGLALVHAVMQLHGGSLELSDAQPGLKVRLCFTRESGYPNKGK